jgi:hypothetical protein
MKLTIRPLTPDLWPALEDLFGDKRNCGSCWCMYWRIGGAYRNRPIEKNKAAFRKVVKGGPPGLLAFDEDVPVGWCQLTPRDALPWLERTWRLKRVDDVPVWSLSCFYVRIGNRRQGVASHLIEAALKAARALRGPAMPQRSRAPGSSRCPPRGASPDHALRSESDRAMTPVGAIGKPVR